MGQSVRGSFPETPSLDSGDIYKSMDGAGIPAMMDEGLLFIGPFRIFLAVLPVIGHIFPVLVHGISVVMVSHIFPQAVVGRHFLCVLPVLPPAVKIFHHPGPVVRHPPVVGGQVIDDKGKGAHHEGDNGKNRRNDDFLHFVSPPLSWPVPIRLVSMARLPSLAIR